MKAVDSSYGIATKRSAYVASNWFMYINDDDKHEKNSEQLKHSMSCFVTCSLLNALAHHDPIITISLTL